jgi:hypothetical protein
MPPLLRARGGATLNLPDPVILLALHTNLGEAEAKLDAIAAARTGGATLNLADPVPLYLWFYP